MASKSFSFAFLFLFFLCTFAAAEPCDNNRFRGGKTFDSCNDLPSLNCLLHWNFHSLTQTVDVALRRNSVDQKTRWMSWAINPHSKGMVGSQALVAFQKDDGTMVAYTSPITSYATQLQKGDLSFPVNGVSSILEGNEMIMFATLALPANTTTVNHLWQERPLAGNFPRMHPLSGPNMGSMGTLDFLVGKLVVDKNRFKKPMEDSSWNFMHIRMEFSNACWSFNSKAWEAMARHCLVSCSCFFSMLGFFDRFSWWDHWCFALAWGTWSKNWKGNPSIYRDYPSWSRCNSRDRRVLQAT
ncbi:hypothetical protein PVK06_000530 [Gossypium arboreum]|uniref:DOMON domain-containing protein n=1 Tax=Gossypium arboreum TaxID=29729 RepID=A0ABR0QYK1_GOSAR|nr:hypothetical protein PVK06_000530 [Gossypium arboreum]